jgi:short-subunit dehydrogenase
MSDDERIRPGMVAATGATGGNGSELGRLLACAGHPLCLVARTQATAVALAQELGGDAFAADVTEPARDL